MPVILIVVAALVISFAPPLPVALKLRLRASGASPAEVQRVSDAFRRGFYSDSSVTPPAEPLGVSRSASLPLDSATRARIGKIVVVDGSVRVIDNRVEVCLQLLNILAQPITGPDTVRVDRDALDSALAVAGHNHAEALVHQTNWRGPSNVRCN